MDEATIETLTALNEVKVVFHSLALFYRLSLALFIVKLPPFSASVGREGSMRSYAA